MYTEYNRLTGMRGQIYFIKGNKRIQVTTDERIYFYLIDPETLEPTLENVMFNYMNCSQMMFGAKVRFGVTFKQNQQDFSIWGRKYYHNFKVTITEMDLEGAVGANIPSSKQCVIAHGARVVVYDINTHKILYFFLVPTKDELDKEILYMTVSDDELRIGICIGRKGIRDSQEVTEIVVYNREGLDDKFELEKVRDFEFADSCMTFAFSKSNPEELLFAASDRIFLYNFNDEGAEV